MEKSELQGVFAELVTSINKTWGAPPSEIAIELSKLDALINPKVQESEGPAPVEIPAP